MVFSDLLFLFEFLAAFALCYLVAGLIDRNGAGESHEQPGVLRKSFKGRNLVTVIFSLIFYAWGEPVYVFLMIFCVFVNYLCGISIDTNVKHKKLGLVLGIIFNLAVLGTFKYLGFFADILGNLGLKVSVPTLALPIGISFYTFQSMSYLIDVYRKESPPQKRFLDLLFYISMFPQLIAGPIVRYGTIAEEIGNRKVTWNDFAEGSYRFLIGLGKKVIIANQISTVADYFLAANPETFSTAGSWIGLLAFTFQIYYDFSGYSDMAIGLGRFLPRLSLYTAWRKPPAPGSEHTYSMVPDRNVARGQLELHPLGRLLWNNRDDRKIHYPQDIRQDTKDIPPPVQHLPLHAWLGNLLL